MSAFVEEPTRTSGARSARGSSTLSAVCKALVVDAQEGPRAGAQPFLADLAAAALADAVGAVLDLRERALDLGERLVRALLDPLVELAVEGDGRHVAEVVVDAAAGELTDLVLHRLPVIVQVRDRALEARALLLEKGAELGDVQGAHRVSFPAAAVAEARRRSVSAGSIPATATTLSRLAWPATSSTSPRPSWSASARSRGTASFARPASGAAATRPLHPPPHPPTTAARAAPGRARRRG